MSEWQVKGQGTLMHETNHFHKMHAVSFRQPVTPYNRDLSVKIAMIWRCREGKRNEADESRQGRTWTH